MGFQPICMHCNGVMLPTPMKGRNMTATTDDRWSADRNGLVKQDLIGEHMVRVTLTPNIPGGVYRVTIGIFWKYGNGPNNKRYREWTSRRMFTLGPLAWQYGVRIVNGATNKARND